MGAVLLQERTDRTKQPVAYLSRALTLAETQLPRQLGEYKTIAWAAEKLAPPWARIISRFATRTC